MIKIIGALAIILSVPVLYGEDSPTWLEIKPGYFFFTDHTLHKIYHGGFEIQASGSYRFYKMFAFYASLGYFHAKGTSLQGDEKTSIWQLPFDVGLRFIADWKESFKGYLSIGPRYFHLNQHNDSPYVNKTIHGNGLGFFINGGCNGIVWDRLLLGVFGEYAFERQSLRPTMSNVYGKEHVQVGGFTVGGSIGCQF